MSLEEESKDRVQLETKVSMSNVSEVETKPIEVRVIN